MPETLLETDGLKLLTGIVPLEETAKFRTWIPEMNTDGWVIAHGQNNGAQYLLCHLGFDENEIPIKVWVLESETGWQS